MNQIVSFDYQSLDAETRIVVQQRTSEIKTLMRRTAQDIFDIGEKLIEVKAKLGHGGFGGWLQAEFDWSESTALRFMRVYTAFKSAKLTDFSIAPSALYLLAAPSTPDEARDEALEMAAAGQTITHADAKQIITHHKPTNSRPAGVHPSSEGVEPDLDEDGLPLTERIEQQLDQRMADQVMRDEEYDEDERIGVGDVVMFGGHNYTVRAVGSKVWVDVSTKHPLYSRGIDFDDVTLVEKKQTPPPAPPRIQGGGKTAPTLPPPPLMEDIVVIDGVPIAETHPMGFQLFFIENNWATCVNCGESHPRWKAARGGDWRCEQPNCKRLTHDDLLIPYTREDVIAEDRNQRRNGNSNGNGHKPAPPPAADPVIAEDDTNDEWYTPADIIAVVREFFGGIDVDPATSEYAQKTVKARTYYTKAEDGLIRDWSGRVWLNPPYSYPLVERFTSELLRQYRAGIVEEAVVLVNNRTDAAWFQSLLAEAISVFVAGRINFNRPGVETSANRQGQVFFYLGNRHTDFSNAFGGYGVVVRCLWSRPEED